MKRLYTIIQLLLVATLVATTFQSCVKDDLTGCPTNVRVYFDYEPATYAPLKEGINPDLVTQINLYVFDDQGVFLGDYKDESPAIKNPAYKMIIPKLEAGKYKIIAWGSLSLQYTLLPTTPVVGQTTFNEFSLRLNEISKENQVTTNLAPLFFGMIGNLEIKENNFSPEVRIRLVQDLYTINVTTKGQISPTASYNMIISDNNGNYLFDNSFSSSSSFDYLKSARRISDTEIFASISTMRLDSSRRNPILKIKNTNNSETIFSENLVDMLMKIQEDYGIEIDFSRMHEFDLEITIKNGSFEVTINGWQVIIDDNPLHQ